MTGIMMTARRMELQMVKRSQFKALKNWSALRGSEEMNSTTKAGIVSASELDLVCCPWS